MKYRIVAVLILVAGYAMSSEPNDGDKQEPLLDLSALRVIFGKMDLIEGHRDEEMTQLIEQEFLESDETEWWACDDAMRFIWDGGCGEDGCPVTLAANHSMALGRVTFAGIESYAQYEVHGLGRQWHWCLQDDDSFRCSFTLDAGGDGVYYDFNAASTTTRSDGSEIAQPAGRFTCERFFPSD